MKKILKSTLACIPALLIMACNPMEEDKSGLGSIPDINNIEYEIVADAEDGSVMHFNILTPQVVGIWQFETPAATKIGVDITQGFATAGTYAVNLSVYNKGGISTQSKRIDFNVPEDSEEFLAAIGRLTTKPWVWDNTTAGHIGNGPEGGTGPDPNWWFAQPNSQDPRVYDDTLKFHTNYAYEHIALGTVLVNEDAAVQWGVSPRPDASVILSYTPPAGQTWNMTLENGNYMLSFGGDGFPSFCPCADWGSKKYTIITLDENILSMRVDLGWGAFYMRFKHPS